jgi:hypothetical protein
MVHKKPLTLQKEEASLWSLQNTGGFDNQVGRLFGLTHVFVDEQVENTSKNKTM